MNNLTNQSVNGVSNFILRTSFAPSMNPPPPCIDAPRSINLFSGLNTAFSMFVSIPPLMTYQNSLFSVEPQRDDNAISSSSTAQFLHSTKNHSGDDSISSEKRHGATYPICAKGSVKICNSLECTNKIDSSLNRRYCSKYCQFRQEKIQQGHILINKTRFTSAQKILMEEMNEAKKSENRLKRYDMAMDKYNEIHKIQNLEYTLNFNDLNAKNALHAQILPYPACQKVSLFSVEPQRDDNAISSSSTAQSLHSTESHSGDDSISSEKRHGATYPICAKGSVKICNSLECANKIDPSLNRRYCSNRCQFRQGKIQQGRTLIDKTRFTSAQKILMEEMNEVKESDNRLERYDMAMDKYNEIHKIQNWKYTLNFNDLNARNALHAQILPYPAGQKVLLFSVGPQRDDNAISSSSTAQSLHSTESHSGDDSISSEKRHGATYPICAKGSVKICNSLECTNKIDPSLNRRYCSKYCQFRQEKIQQGHILINKTRFISAQKILREEMNEAKKSENRLERYDMAMDKYNEIHKI